MPYTNCYLIFTGAPQGIIESILQMQKLEAWRFLGFFSSINFSRLHRPVHVGASVWQQQSISRVCALTGFRLVLCLATLAGHTGVTVLPAYSGQRPGTLPNILQCTGQPPQQKSLRPKVSVLRLRNPVSWLASKYLRTLGRFNLSGWGSCSHYSSISQWP